MYSKFLCCLLLGLNYFGAIFTQVMQCRDWQGLVLDDSFPCPLTFIHFGQELFGTKRTLRSLTTTLNMDLTDSHLQFYFSSVTKQIYNYKFLWFVLFFLFHLILLDLFLSFVYQQIFLPLFKIFLLYFIEETYSLQCLF